VTNMVVARRSFFIIAPPFKLQVCSNPGHPAWIGADLSVWWQFSTKV
jgi:hypothetical protein